MVNASYQAVSAAAAGGHSPYEQSVAPAVVAQLEITSSGSVTAAAAAAAAAEGGADMLIETEESVEAGSAWQSVAEKAGAPY